MRCPHSATGARRSIHRPPTSGVLTSGCKLAERRYGRPKIRPLGTRRSTRPPLRLARRIASARRVWPKSSGRVQPEHIRGCPARGSMAGRGSTSVRKAAQVPKNCARTCEVRRLVTRTVSPEAAHIGEPHFRGRRVNHLLWLNVRRRVVMRDLPFTTALSDKHREARHYCRRPAAPFCRAGGLGSEYSTAGSSLNPLQVTIRGLQGNETLLSKMIVRVSEYCKPGFNPPSSMPLFVSALGFSSGIS